MTHQRCWQISSLPVLEARTLKPWCWEGCASSGGCSGESASVLRKKEPQLLQSLAGLGGPLALSPSRLSFVWVRWGPGGAFSYLTPNPCCQGPGSAYCRACLLRLYGDPHVLTRPCFSPCRSLCCRDTVREMVSVLYS